VAFSRSAVEVGAPGDPPPARVAGELGTVVCDQPWNETTALASTNRIAAPATSDPAVPNPATYARVARISTLAIGR
jgi:hypothetical protein